MADDGNPIGAEDEASDLADNSEDIAVASAASSDEVAQNIQHTARAATVNLTAHDNLTFLPLRWLHEGRFSVKGAVAVNVRRHSDGSHKGTYMFVEFWKRGRVSDSFLRRQRVNFTLEDTEQLLTYLRQAEAAAGIEAGQVVVLPAAEVFDNLNESQRETCANVLGDLARSHRVADLMTTGHFTVETVEHLAAAAQQVKYKAALAQLREMVTGVVSKPKRGGGSRPLNEHDYQDWFEEHTWVFGTEYIRRIELRDIDPHASVDIILETADGFFDVLELKMPSASVLSHDSSHNTWYFTADVAKAIAQAAKYLKAIERNADHINVDEGIALVRPRVRVVIGRSDINSVLVLAVWRCAWATNESRCSSERDQAGVGGRHSARTAHLRGPRWRQSAG